MKLSPRVRKRARPHVQSALAYLKIIDSVGLSELVARVYKQPEFVRDPQASKQKPADPLPAPQLTPALAMPEGDDQPQSLRQQAALLKDGSAVVLKWRNDEVQQENNR